MAACCCEVAPCLLDPFSVRGDEEDISLTALVGRSISAVVALRRVGMTGHFVQRERVSFLTSSFANCSLRERFAILIFLTFARTYHHTASQISGGTPA
jgi:hypothetical protein